MAYHVIAYQKRLYLESKTSHFLLNLDWICAMIRTTKEKASRTGGLEMVLDVRLARTLSGH